MIIPSNFPVVEMTKWYLIYAFTLNDSNVINAPIIDFSRSDESESVNEMIIEDKEAPMEIDRDNEITIEDETVHESDKTKTHNFSKMKGKYSNKRAEHKRKIRSTDEGKEANQKIAIHGMSKLRSTPRGKEDNRARSEKLRSTEKGKEDNRKTALEGMSKLRSILWKRR